MQVPIDLGNILPQAPSLPPERPDGMSEYEGNGGMREKEIIWLARRHGPLNRDPAGVSSEGAMHGIEHQEPQIHARASP
jgi:hypothetical protein